MSNRNYSSVARATTLTSSVSGSSTLFPVTETTGFPTPPFTMVADPGRSGEEVVTVSNLVGTNLTVIRGQDGTAAQPHDAGATLRHMATARDFRESADHIGLESNVHGVTGEIVGTLDVQAIDNKTFTPAVGDHTSLVVKAGSGQSAPLVTFRSAADALLSSVGVDGKVNTPGVNGTGQSLFTGVATDIPVTVKGAVSQTAHLLSAKSSGGAEIAFIDAVGNVSGTALTSTTSVTAASASITGRVATQGVDGTGTSVFTPAGTANTPLVAVSPTGSTVSAFAVRDAATNLSQAGVSGENAGFRLYHGGSNTNYLPLRIHCGKLNTNIISTNASTLDTVDLTSFGFTQVPVVTATVYVGSLLGDQSRVGVEIQAISATSVTFRTIQMQGNAVGASSDYVIHWTAIQASSSNASG